MQSLGRRYVQYINREYHRCGTLWESRHKASLIDAAAYLLSCYCYVELNPVRANMVNHPSEYPWSSYPYNGAGDPDHRITEHDVYMQLGSSRSERAYRYRTLFSTALDQKAIHAIRTAANFSMPLGNNRFKAQIEATLSRQIGQAKRGRPPRYLQDEK